MAPPDKLRIELDEGRFKNIGKLSDGTQFMAYVTGAMPDGMKYPSHEQAYHYKRWLAVIHRFDAEGNHIGSEVRLGGYDREGRDISGDKAWEQLEEMYADLTVNGEPEFCDIWVKPFSVTIDGVSHGLFYRQYEPDDDDEEDDYEGEWVMLEPNDVMFHPPWDSGDFST